MLLTAKYNMILYLNEVPQQSITLPFENRNDPGIERNLN